MKQKRAQEHGVAYRYVSGSLRGAALKQHD
jgi:hypothetical protein